ncbi:TPA: hypothetical protein ACHWKL_003612 [Providencia stuartii]|uniref:hypothetical protein n=1 Tax=Providencia rettgeri TaxID=587 RepID=UPI001F03C74B|nr:hypothetical protein [Providencia rettgeri]MCG9951653.1 hypothetical protein [Providencia rettgeri]
MSQMKTREFLQSIAELKQALSKDIQAFSTGLDASPEAIRERRRRVLNGDFAFFAYTYFPHHIRGEQSLFHAHFCQRFPQLLTRQGGAIEWWIAPRGEAKSSLLTKIGPVWCAVQALHQRDDVRSSLGITGERPTFIDYIILLGAETKLPAKLLEVVKTELTVNAALALDFPEVCGKGPQWKIGEFVTRSGVKIESFGAEQAIRGTFHGASRPKLLLGDDLITDAEAKSPTERDNRWNWLSKAIEYLGPPDGSVKYIGVGTVLDKDDPISRAKRTIGHIVHHFKAIVTLPTHMDLWEQCQEKMLNDDGVAEEEAAKAGIDLPPEMLPSYQFYLANKVMMDDGAVISWPSVRTLYWLMRQRAKNGKAFATEMQGDPRTDEDKTFINIQFFTQRWRNWLIFGACDPSMGKGETSDPSSILVGGWDKEKHRLHVMEAEIKRRLPSKLEADLIAVQRAFNCISIGFENNNAYEHSRQTFIKAGMRQGVALPLVGVTASVPLEVRIESLEPYINDQFMPGIVFDPKLTLLLSELDTWPEPQSGHHYDGLSALHILWMIAVSRGAGNFEWQPVPNRGDSSHHGDDYFMDDADGSSFGRELW